MKRLAVFASGSGSNFAAIADAVDDGVIHAELTCLVCDKTNAKVIERAKDLGIDTFVITPKTFDSKADYEKEIVANLTTKHVDFIALAGYMRLVGPILLRAYKNKIVNIHPSLLPAFPGLNAIGQALNAGVKVTGVTVHYVDEGMDTGPIIAQECVRISEGDSKSDLEEKVHGIEHQLYPETIAKLLNG